MCCVKSETKLELIFRMQNQLRIIFNSKCPQFDRKVDIFDWNAWTPFKYHGIRQYFHYINKNIWLVCFYFRTTSARLAI